MSMVWYLIISAVQLVILGVSLRSFWLAEYEILENNTEKRCKYTFALGTIVFLILLIVFWNTFSIAWLSLYVGLCITIIFGHDHQGKIAGTISNVVFIACLVVAFANIDNHVKNYDSNIKAIGETVSVETSMNWVPVNKSAAVTLKKDKGYTFAYISENGEKKGGFAPIDRINVHYIGATEDVRLIKIVEKTPAINYNYNPAPEITKETTRYELYIQLEEIGVE